MKNNYNLDDFDNFLSDSAEQHRMYPSDRVWRNIDQELHGNKSWPALTFGAILTGAIITAGLILIHPDKNLFTVNLADPQTTLLATGENAQYKTKALSSNIGSNSQKKDKAIINKNLNDPNTVDFYPENSGSNSSSKAEEYRPDTENLNLIATKPEDIIRQTENIPIVEIKQNAGIPAQPLPIEIGHIGIGRSLQFATLFHSKTNGNFPSTGTGFLQGRSNIEPNATDFRINESVVNNINKLAGKNSSHYVNNNSRWSLLFYTTPSISFRNLSEAKIVDLHLQQGPIAPNLTHGVNNFVRHKATLGLEFGSGIMYNLTPSIRIRTGLQVNIRGYSIEAFASNRETSTILLNRGYYTDSLIATSSINTQEGYKSIEINNRYWEVGIPLALDMRITNWNKIQLYVAAGIQPTYQYNKSMYMISNDYKNYVQEPDLTRQWNMNTTLEAFISYKAAGLTWQAGPQIRYQLLPGTINQYPVRERLLDYGLKIGVVKTLN